MTINKSVLTNGSALVIVIIGSLVSGPYQTIILYTGLFALSGGITNWLAIHMLFERVPGLYGSGVVPARFEEFKAGLHQLITEQFFNRDNIQNFLQERAPNPPSALDKIIGDLDLEQAYEALVDVIERSSFGSMLGMLGGAEALKPLKEPFIEKMRQYLHTAAGKLSRQHQLSALNSEALLQQVEAIVAKRLDELTPTLVKNIVQQMIKQHLGWLVVWGGVLGGLLGLLTALLLL